MNHIDLFSGIGGFALGADLAGMGFEKRYYSEIDEYVAALYQQHFPAAIPVGDITKHKEWKIEKADCIVTGGFPCQPHSWIGRRGGASDERYLWPRMFEVIQDLEPVWAIIENVPGIISDGTLDIVCSDMESGGYDVAPLIFPAASIGAPHIRYRVYIVSHLESLGREQRDQNGRGSQERKRAEKQRVRPSDGDRWAAEPAVCRMANGIPRRVDRIKGLGNAIVPQIAEMIFRNIKRAESTGGVWVEGDKDQTR